MDNPYQLFHTRIIEAIQSAEVMSLIFPRFGKTLVLDLRHTVEIPAWIAVDDIVGSPEERLSRFEKMRPLLPLPDELRIAAWIGSVGSLNEAGIVDAMLERCSETGEVAVVEQCREAIEDLDRYERRHLRAVVRGSLSRTIWQREES
jgi:hypothetical protein